MFFSQSFFLCCHSKADIFWDICMHYLCAIFGLLSVQLAQMTNKALGQTHKRNKLFLRGSINGLRCFVVNIMIGFFTHNFC